MDSENSGDDHRPKRQRREDDGEGFDGSEQRKPRRHRDEDPVSHRRRERSGSRQRERRGRPDRRDRSRSPGHSDRRGSRDRDGRRGRERRRRRRSHSVEEPPSRRRDARDDGRARRDKHGERIREGHDDRERRRHRHSRLDGSDGDGSVEKGTPHNPVRRGAPLPSQDDSFAISKGEEPEKPKEKPNYGNSGLLAAASNQVTQQDGSTITLKYHEPPEARKPPARNEWKLFVFKDSEIIDTVDLNGRSCWLIGRETAVVDLLAEHPSLSKQHAVVQFRYLEKRNEFGDRIGKVKPYLIDLESANGTKLNGEKIPASRYLELREKDMIQFGLSTREYVLMLASR